MAMQQGEKYRCSDANCGCEMQVTKGPKAGMNANASPKCCCGKDMNKI